MKSLRFVMPVLAACMCVGWANASHAGCLDEEYMAQFENRDVILKRTANHARVGYLNDELSTYFSYADERLYLYTIDHRVSLDSIRAKVEVTWKGAVCNWIVAWYHSSFLGKQSIEFRSEMDRPMTTEQVEACVRTVFLFDTTQTAWNAYAISLSSGMVHSVYCDHLPMAGYQEVAVLTAADSTRLCRSCFRPPSELPDQGLELQMGRLAVESFETFNVTTVDDDMQARLEEAGLEVLANWPLPLRGYDYRFIVVDNPNPNAFAAPGGTVFATSGLMELVETDAELISVLAHEVTHVEFRHGIRQFKSAQKGQTVGILAAALAGIAVGVATNDAGYGMLAAGATAVMSDLFTDIALNGYAQKYELEADHVARLYQMKNDQSEAELALGRMLRKLRYRRDEIPHKLTAANSEAHPPISQRLKKLNTGHMELLDPPLAYELITKRGDTAGVFVIRAVYQTEIAPPIDEGPGGRRARSTHELICYADIYTNVWLRDPTELKHIEFDGVKGRLDNEQDTKLIPGQKSGVVLYYKEEQPMVFDASNKLKISMGRVDKARRVDYASVDWAKY